MHEPAAGKPRLLFLTPVLPDHRGNGLSMRGALFLDALSSRYEVFVHVIAIFPPARDLPFPSSAAGRVVLQPVARLVSPGTSVCAHTGAPSICSGAV